MASVPAGVRAEGHDAEACPLTPEVLPPLLRQRMGRARPRGTPAPGALRLRVPRQRERLPGHRRHGEGGAHHHLQRRDPWRAWHPGRRMDTSASALPRQETVIPATSGATMTAPAVPVTSCRGCPSMAAGTIVLPPATTHASYALPTANWCRFDASGESPSTAVLHCASALARSYITLSQHPADQPHKGHRSMFHHRPQPVPMTSYRGTKGHSVTYGVSPQQVES